MRSLLPAILLTMIVTAGTALGCGCVGDPNVKFETEVINAFNSVDAVFLGKVNGFVFIKDVPFDETGLLTAAELKSGSETKTAVFAVEKWWKGDESLPISTKVITDERRVSNGNGTNSSCNYLFEEGKTYLVFASKVGGYFKTHSCSFTRTADHSKNLLLLIGDGRAPAKTETPVR